MPGKTGAPHEIPYTIQSDKPPSAEEATKPLADRVHKRLDEIAPSQLVTAGAGDAAKILVVQNTGAAAFKALSGDVTISAAGVAEIGAGKVGTTELADKGVTTGKINDSAVTADKTAKAVREATGLTGGGEVRRGRSIIAAEESRTNTAYGLLGTPDRVQSIVLPEDGLIKVLFSALWETTVSEAGRAALFVDAEQYRARVRVPTGASPAILAAKSGASGGVRPLASAGIYGIASGNDQTANADATMQGIGLGAADSNKAIMMVGVGETESIEVPTQGGETVIWAPAGTYTVSVQFRATSGTVKVKNRRLYVWTKGF